MPQIESPEEVARAQAAERALARVKELEAILNSYATGDSEVEVETLAQEMFLAATRDGQQSNCGWKGLVTDQRDYWKRFARRYLHRVAASTQPASPSPVEGLRWTLWICPVCGEQAEEILRPGIMGYAHGHYHDDAANPRSHRRIFHPAVEVDVIEVAGLEGLVTRCEASAASSTREEEAYRRRARRSPDLRPSYLEAAEAHAGSAHAYRELAKEVRNLIEQGASATSDKEAGEVEG